MPGSVRHWWESWGGHSEQRALQSVFIHLRRSSLKLYKFMATNFFFFFNSKKQWEALVSWLCTCVCVWLLWMSIGGYSTVKWGVLRTRHITLVINSQTGLCQVPSGENGATTPSCLSQQRIRASVTRCWKSFANRRAMLWGSLLSSHTVSHSCLKPLGQFLHTFGLF